MKQFLCLVCHGSVVKYDGGVCYKCWHKINFSRQAKGPLFQQLDLFEQRPSAK